MCKSDHGLLSSEKAREENIGAYSKRPEEINTVMCRSNRDISPVYFNSVK